METTNPTLGPVTEREPDVARTLEDAALYIETYGWCQGSFTEAVPGNQPRACALGAITLVRHPRRDNRACPHVLAGTVCPSILAIDYLADFLDDGIWRDDQSTAEVVWAFNDHPDSTQYLITHALRAAAKRARIELNQQAVA